MKNPFLSRGRSGGKNSSEKQNYRQFLNTPRKEIEDTLSSDSNEGKIFEDSQDFSDKLSFVGDKTPIKGNKPKKPYKSRRTKFSQWFKRYAKEIIVAVVLIPLVSVVWFQQEKLGEIAGSLSVLKDNISALSNKYDNNLDDKIDSIETNVEIKKDFEFIKERINKIEKFIGL